ncbi:MAG: hypothetical protein KGZ25_09305, partial [Planctomycetes bacterium]|nr:hypothetical protein [Planctomycetota bacterium]
MGDSEAREEETVGRQANSDYQERKERLTPRQLWAFRRQQEETGQIVGEIPPNEPELPEEDEEMREAKVQTPVTQEKKKGNHDSSEEQNSPTETKEEIEAEKEEKETEKQSEETSSKVVNLPPPPPPADSEMKEKEEKNEEEVQEVQPKEHKVVTLGGNYTKPEKEEKQEIQPPEIDHKTEKKSEKPLQDEEDTMADLLDSILAAAHEEPETSESDKKSETSEPSYSYTPTLPKPGGKPEDPEETAIELEEETETTVSSHFIIGAIIIAAALFVGS